jgi:type II secretory pathway component GspD/PulD (secretin)
MTYLYLILILICTSSVYAQSPDSVSTNSFASQLMGENAALTAPVLAPQAISDQDYVPAKEGIVIDELILNQTDLKEALKIIAQKSGFHILFDDNLEGKITVRLKNVDTLDALRIVLDETGYAYDMSEGVVSVKTLTQYETEHSRSFDFNLKAKITEVTHPRIKSVMDLLERIKSENGKIIYGGIRPDTLNSIKEQDEIDLVVLLDKPEKIDSMLTLISKVDVAVQTRKIKLDNLYAKDLVKTIKERLTKNVGDITADSDDNSLLVTDTPNKIDEMDRFVSRLDKQAKKILIDTRTIQVTLNDEHKDGVDWEAIVSDYKTMDLKSHSENSFSGKINLGLISEEDYAVLIEALDTVGEIREVGHEELITPAEESCNLTVASLEPVFRDQANQPGAQLAQTKMKVVLLPKREQNNSISVEIRPEGTGGGTPPLDPQMLSVPAGSLIVLGGLIKEDSVPSIKKVPVLGDIPILGFIFRNQGIRTQRSEVITFLTPRNIFNQDVEKKVQTDSPDHDAAF